MEKRSPAPKSKEKPPSAETIVLGLAGLTLATGVALDFTLHFNGGVSDPELRKLYYQYLGDLTNYIGNFGFAAAATIPVITLNKVLHRLETAPEEMTLFDHLLDLGTLFTVSALLATITASESFPNNNHQYGDIVSSGLGVLLSAFTTDRTLHRARVGRSDVIKLRADKLFPLTNIPVNVESHRFLSNTPNSVDSLFSN